LSGAFLLTEIPYGNFENPSVRKAQASRLWKLVAADVRSVGRPEKRSMFLWGRSGSDESNP